MRPATIDLTQFKTLHGKNEYTVLVPDPDFDTYFELEIYATKPITIWLSTADNKVPISVSDRFIGRHRVVALNALVLTAAKNTVISYRCAMAPVSSDERLDPTPVEIEMPDPAELAYQRQIKMEVERELLKLGIDPNVMIEEELDDDEAWELDDDDDITRDQPYADELLESESPVPQQLPDGDQSDDSTADSGRRSSIPEPDGSQIDEQNPVPEKA